MATISAIIVTINMAITGSVVWMVFATSMPVFEGFDGEGGGVSGG